MNHDNVLVSEPNYALTELSIYRAEVPDFPTKAPRATHAGNQASPGQVLPFTYTGSTKGAQQLGAQRGEPRATVGKFAG